MPLLETKQNEKQSTENEADRLPSLCHALQCLLQRKFFGGRLVDRIEGREVAAEVQLQQMVEISRPRRYDADAGKKQKTWTGFSPLVHLLKIKNADYRNWDPRMTETKRV